MHPDFEIWIQADKRAHFVFRNDTEFTLCTNFTDETESHHACVVEEFEQFSKSEEQSIVILVNSSNSVGETQTSVTFVAADAGESFDLVCAGVSAVWLKPRVGATCSPTGSVPHTSKNLHFANCL